MNRLIMRGALFNSTTLVDKTIDRLLLKRIFPSCCFPSVHYLWGIGEALAPVIGGGGGIP
jgi:hypothetical protein